MSRTILAFALLFMSASCIHVYAQENPSLANKKKIEELKARLARLDDVDGDKSSAETQRLEQVIRQQRDTIAWLESRMSSSERSRYESSGISGGCNCIRVYYDLGEHTADYARYPELDSIALVAKVDQSLIVKVVGHADWRGNQSANEVLALKRAQDLRLYLGRKYRIGLDRIVTAGDSRRETAEEAADPNVLHLNRRVEISVIRQQ
jgi:outer membrane protein OmpA-like peptidoglycan-associated protein